MLNPESNAFRTAKDTKAIFHFLHNFNASSKRESRDERRKKKVPWPGIGRGIFVLCWRWLFFWGSNNKNMKSANNKPEKRETIPRRRHLNEVFGLADDKEPVGGERNAATPEKSPPASGEAWGARSRRTKTKMCVQVHGEKEEGSFASTHLYTFSDVDCLSRPHPSRVATNEHSKRLWMETHDEENWVVKPFLAPHPNSFDERRNLHMEKRFAALWVSGLWIIREIRLINKQPWISIQKHKFNAWFYEWRDLSLASRKASLRAGIYLLQKIDNEMLLHPIIIMLNHTCTLCTALRIHNATHILALQSSNTR